MAGVDASTIINYYIACVVSIGFHFIRLRIDLQLNGAGDIVFKNFMLIDKSVNCFKLFITAYRQAHAGGVGLLLFACLIGFSIHLCAIVVHLSNNHRSRAIALAWISGMAVFLAAGACMLAMKIPQEYAWHGIAVEAILHVVICLEAVILVRSKISEHGGSDNLLQDLIMTSVETLINYWLFAYYLVNNTHSPWDAHNILHLVGSSLDVLIGLGQIGLLAYKAYTHGVFAWGAGTAAGAATDVGDVEQQVVEEGAEVEEGGMKTCPLFTREVEMAAGAATIEGASDEGEGRASGCVAGSSVCTTLLL